MAILKKLLIATLVASLPALAAAADPAPATGAKPVAAAESTQKSPTAASTESKPSDAAAAHQTIRIGFVDTQRIVKETVRGKAIDAKLKGMKDRLQARIDTKRKPLDKLRASFGAKLATLPPEQREAKAKEFQKELQKKAEEFQKFGKQLEEDFYTTQEKETKGLYDATEQAAVAYGKANGFAVIVVKKELLYAGDHIDAQDVTDAIIKAMDEAARKK
ncbi:MAG: OmpH family outer membrane protein [Oryzomonas sp.]|uniref:OmpH family outer membrane protein n=1 Tax=Oryzomonas sp. TaxID=2855186 RepID=UPI002841671F|nr:OmpH family outer membrane protein [Oryzomonas sp.]MDR3580171.1 OmpH family outer membrane protein [Oryzomonas sp.]